MRGRCGAPDVPHAVNDVSLLAEGSSVGEFSHPSVIVNINDDRDKTFKTTDEGVFGLKNRYVLGPNGQDLLRGGDHLEGAFGIVGVGVPGKGVAPSCGKDAHERTRMASDGGLTNYSSASSSGDEESDSEEHPTSDDDSGFAFASAFRGCLDDAVASGGGVDGAVAARHYGPGGSAAGDAAVPVRFTVPLTSSLEIAWDALLWRQSLIVTRLPAEGANGSKESLIQLLEFAEDQLGCDSVFIFLPKTAPGPGSTTTCAPSTGMTSTMALIRMFSFLGFTNVKTKDQEILAKIPKSVQATPGLLDGTIMVYDIGDFDF